MDAILINRHKVKEASLGIPFFLFILCLYDFDLRDLDNISFLIINLSIFLTETLNLLKKMYMTKLFYEDHVNNVLKT